MKRPWMGLLIVAGMAVYSVLVLPALPAEIPIHWDLAGASDNTMSKVPGAFLMVLAGIGVWLLFAGLPRIDPRRNHYAGFRDSYWLLGNLALAFLAAVHVLMLGIGLGWDVDLVQALLIGMGLLFVGVSPLLPRLSSNRWTGIRTPWTLASETVWRRTHRVGGYTFAPAGLLIAATAFLPHPTRLWISGLLCLAMVTVPAAYSFFVWRGLGDSR